ncbi:MAG: acyl-CoA dehydrogenase family protein, partial [Acidimicrobiia bacterium]|nr:acyl-CoA dehydrogenase family protein [Acidimicrobiia bacterium]
MTTTAAPTRVPNHTAEEWVEVADRVGAIVEPTVAENDRTGEISRLAYEHLRSEGVTAALVPSEFGGGGASHETMGMILRTLGRVDAPSALTLSMHSHVL